MNERGWTDQDLSIPVEERGRVEAVPGNQSPGYQNAEHWYNEHGDRPLGGDGFPNTSGPYYNAEHWYNEHGDAPLGDGFPNTSGAYKSTEEYYSEGFTESGGPNINGKTPKELIESGELTADTITEEQKQVVYQDIMMGVTNDKNMLASKIDLIISDKNLVNRILSNQYSLAIQEMKMEERGSVDSSPTDRKFQFLATVKILMEKGYDVGTLSFEQDGKKIDLARLMSGFRKECTEHKAKSINDPSWFKEGEPPENYDKRKVNNPWLFSGTLITEIYASNPEKFKSEYENYKANSARAPEDMLSYEEFMHYTYGIDVTAISDKSQGQKNITWQDVGKETTKYFTSNPDKASEAINTLETKVKGLDENEKTEDEK